MIFRELFCWHSWRTHMVNITCQEGSTSTLTLCSKECKKCGASKLVFIYGN